ncbi:MAG: DUF1570 domain-containing protein [Parashewanella sp.]
MESKLSRYIVFVISVFAIAIMVDHFQGKWINIQLTQWVERVAGFFGDNPNIELVTTEHLSTTEPINIPNRVTEFLSTYKANQLDREPRLIKKHNEVNSHHQYAEQHSNVCTSAELTLKQKQQRQQALQEDLVFSWVDDKGVKHFSNTLFGAGDDVQVLAEYQAQLEPFVLSVNSAKVLPQHFENKVTVGIKKIYRVLSLYLEKQHVREVAVNLTFAHSKGEYKSIQKQKAPNLGPSLGFYSSSDNFAAVWYQNTKQAQQTAIHEATHVINSGLFGITPRWINEGLAEYFERMNIFGLAIKIPPQNWVNQHKVNRITLESLLNSSEQDWKGSTQSTMYSASHSLIHFLMSTPKGKVIAKRLLSHLALNRCGETNVRGVLSLYPDGLYALERDWHYWMANEKYKVQSL